MNSNLAVDAVVNLVKRKEFEKELPKLDEAQDSNLRTSIKRDGVLDSIKYRRNENGECEIIDGHNRYRIASELGISYPVEEIVFKTFSITPVLYWMHVYNAGRRGGKVNAKRMLELRQQLAIDSGQAISKTQAVNEVAKDADVPVRNVWRAVTSKDKPVKQTALERIVQMIGKLSAEDRAELVRIISI